MAQKPITVIEVGTTRTVVLVGRPHGNAIDVLGVGTAPTTGVHKSNVQKMEYATKSAAKALERAETAARTTINSVYLIHSGSDLQCSPVTSKEVLRHGEIIDAAVIKTLTDNLHRTPEDPERFVIDDIRQHFVIDEKRIVEDPENMPGKSLRVNGIRLHMDGNSHEAMINAVEDANVEVAETIFSALSAAKICTEAEQKHNGVLVIDLGGGSTSWCVYKHGTPLTAGAIAIGGDHITKDILEAFKLGSRQSAESVKREHGQATLDGIDPAKRIAVKQPLGMPERTISHKALTLVVNARIDETLRIVFDEIQAGGFLNALGAGVVLCGGGALLKDVSALVANIFRAPCMFATLPAHVHPDIDAAPDKIAFASAYGALFRAAQIENENEKTNRGIFGGLFKRNGGDQ